MTNTTLKLKDMDFFKRHPEINADEMIEQTYQYIINNSVMDTEYENLLEEFLNEME